jgi:hypothetical protein
MMPPVNDSFPSLMFSDKAVFTEHKTAYIQAQVRRFAPITIHTVLLFYAGRFPHYSFLPPFAGTGDRHKITGQYSPISMWAGGKNNQQIDSL